MPFETLMDPLLKMVGRKFMSSLDLLLMIRTTVRPFGPDLTDQTPSLSAAVFKYAPTKTEFSNHTDSHSTTFRPLHLKGPTVMRYHLMELQNRHFECADLVEEGG